LTPVIKKRILQGVLMVLLLAFGICLGSYYGYTRGYRHGEKISNAWWIQKQSRYYDTDEVQQKRRSQNFDRL